MVRRSAYVGIWHKVLPWPLAGVKRTQNGGWRQFSILCEIGRIGTTFSVDIILLPAVIVLEKTVKIFAGRGHLLRPKPVVLVDVQHMHRVRQGERPITLDDQKILVVAIRGFVAEIMAAAGDDRI